MKKLSLVIIILSCTFIPASANTVSGQNQPRIAVYVTGSVPENEKKALGTMILTSLVNSGRYKGIERSAEFVAEIDNEHIRQRSGAIDDSQITELGKQYGVEFICIADITPALGDFQISARIINVETAEIVFIGASSSPLKTMKDLSSVADRVVRAMFGLPEPDKTKSGLSVGAGGFFASDFGGGIIWSDAAQQIAMPYSGGGAFLFFDAVYAEASVGFAIGGGKWESDNVTNPQELPEMSRVSLTFGLFGKYPVDAGPVTIFPLLGIDYELAVTAKFTRTDGTEVSIDGRNGRPGNAGEMSALWVKFGGGLDYSFSDNMYLRTSLLYGMRTANKFENDNVELDKDMNAQVRIGHGVTVRIGVGVRF
jgi:hypothetical protein